MARMRALVRHTMNQHQQHPGDCYDADESSANIAESLGWCERAPSGQPVSSVVAAAAVRTKRKYNRRVLTTAK